MPRTHKTRSNLNKIRSRRNDLINLSADEIINVNEGSAVSIHTTTANGNRKAGDRLRVFNHTNSTISVRYPILIANQYTGNVEYYLVQDETFSTIPAKQNKTYRFVLHTPGVENGKGTWAEENSPSAMVAKIIKRPSDNKTNIRIVTKKKNDEDAFYISVLSPIFGPTWVSGGSSGIINNIDYRNGTVVFKPRIVGNKFFLYGAYGTQSTLYIDLDAKEYVFISGANLSNIKEYRKPFGGFALEGWTNVDNPQDVIALSTSLRGTNVQINKLIEDNDYLPFDNQFLDRKEIYINDEKLITSDRYVPFDLVSANKAIFFNSINGNNPTNSTIVITNTKAEIDKNEYANFDVRRSPLWNKYSLTRNNDKFWQILDLKNNKFYYNFNFKTVGHFPTKGWVDAENIKSTAVNNIEIDIVVNPNSNVVGSGSGSGSGSGGGRYYQTVGLPNINNAINDTYNVVLDFGFNQYPTSSRSFFSYTPPPMGGDDIRDMPLGRYVKKIFSAKNSSTDFTFLYKEPQNTNNRLIYFRDQGWKVLGANDPIISDDVSIANLNIALLWLVPYTSSANRLRILSPKESSPNSSFGFKRSADLIKIVQDNTTSIATYSGKGNTFFEVYNNGKVYLSTIQGTPNFLFHQDANFSDNSTHPTARILFAENVYNGLFFCESDAVSYVQEINGQKILISKERNENGEFVPYRVPYPDGSEGYQDIILNSNLLSSLELSSDLGDLQKIILHTQPGGMGKRFSRYHILTKTGKLKGLGFDGAIKPYGPSSFSLESKFITDITFNFGMNEIFCVTSDYRLYIIRLGTTTMDVFLQQNQFRLISDRLFVRKMIGDGDSINGFYNGIYFIQGLGTTLNQSGTGVWNNKYYIGGVETTLNSSGTGTWNNYYYIGGTQTTLDSSGTGAWNNKVYQNGIELNISGSTGSAGSAGNLGPGLGLDIINQILKDLNFTGTIYDRQYINGDPATGLFEGIYYIQGAATTLPLSGTGVWQNKYYIGGTETTLNSSGNGTWNNYYYIGGTQTTLDSSGNGTWNNLRYSNGTLFTGFTAEAEEMYYVNGVLTTLNSSGNGTWNNYYYIGGTQTTLDSSGNGTWNNLRYSNGTLFTGFIAEGEGMYYVNGVLTTLNYSGNGTWNNYYYIGGTQTTLDSSGTGVWQNKYYIGGTETTLNSSGTGAWNDKYYIGGSETTLPLSGTGLWNNKYYIGGVETTLDSSGTGVWQNKYYIGGVETTLDSSGTGAWNDKYYIGGSETTLPLSGTGLWNNKYYIGGVETTLDSSGTGVWNNKRYANGNLLTGVFEGVYYTQGEPGLDENGNGILNNKLYQNGVEILPTPQGNQGNQGLAFEEGNYKFRIINNKLALCGINTSFITSEMIELTLPGSAFNGIPVKSIATTTVNAGAFQSSNLQNIKRIIIPLAITEIGPYSFTQQNNLEEVVLHNQIVSIGNDAFLGCYRLVNINIPNSVTTIGNMAFGSYASVARRSITIPRRFASQIFVPETQYTGLGIIPYETDITFIEDDGTLTGFNKTDNVYYVKGSPSTLSSTGAGVWNNEKYLWGSLSNLDASGTGPLGSSYYIQWQKAFDWLATDGKIAITRYNIFYSGHLAIPSHIYGAPVESIDQNAIRPNEQYYGVFNRNINNLLTEITIPYTMINIKEQSFKDFLNLVNINVDSNNLNYLSLNGVLYNKDMTTLIFYPVGKQDSSFEIPNGTINIASNAFNATALIIYQNYNFPAPGYYSLSPLTNVTIPNTVTNIGSSAFVGTNIISINVPDSVTVLGTAVFSSNRSLVSATLGNGITVLPSDTFWNCYELTTVNLPQFLSKIERTAFRMNKINSLVIPSSVIDINEGTGWQGSWRIGALTMLHSLTSITLPPIFGSKNRSTWLTDIGLSQIQFMGANINITYHNGWYNGIYYINNDGTATTLDQNGSGVWNNQLYQNGSII